MTKSKVKVRVDALIAKRKELEEITKPVWKTSCHYRTNTMSDRGGFDIRQASVTQLVDGYKSILNHDQVCKELGVEAKHLGYSADDWKADFQLRIKQLNRSRILADIRTYTDALRPLLSKAELRDLQMDEMDDSIDAILEAKNV